MSDLDDLWSEALQEAYATAPTDQVIICTLEFRHPSFTDDNGDPIAIRMVRDPGELLTVTGVDEEDIFGWELGLEAGAPLDSGTVVFVSCMFDFSLPAQQTGRVPEIEISFDRVAGYMVPYLDEAIKFRAPMEVTYREYLHTDHTTPQFVLNGLQMRRIEANDLRVRGAAGFTDLLNKVFPGYLYQPEEFKGLMQ